LPRLLRHFLPDFNAWLDDLPEHRSPKLLYYHRRHLIWGGLLLFLLHLRSRLQFTLERGCSTLAANLVTLAGTTEDAIAHGDTLAGWFRRVPAAQVLGLVQRCVRRLIRMKALDDFRVEGHFPVAVDATGMLSFDHRHCPHCLTRQLSNGGTLYYHPVLEAKLVAENGLALSVATDFIENPEGWTPETKQDCEKKAFHRLAEQLYDAFPRTPFCLLLDALYLDHGVLAHCAKHGWKFLITFKEGSMPAVWAEAQRLLHLQPGNRLALTLRNGTRRLYRWAENVDVGGLHALFCEETKADGSITHFAWLTNFTITRQNAIALADRGGRLRWKIENEGFNTQKNGGFALKHAYCRDGNAARVFYGLLQLAHLFQQLLTLGGLLRPFRKRFVTVRNFVRRLTESLRHERLPPLADLPPIGQFRWNSS
jgi:hypothetical protein